MNLGENLVGSALQSLGYFTIQGLREGVREADFLAIKIENKKTYFYHIEVQLSHNPVGVLRPSARFGTSEKNPQKSAKGFIEKKFYQKKLCKKIEKVFGTKKYDRMFIYGRLKNPKQLNIFEARGINCISIGELIQKAAHSDAQTEALKSFCGISSQINENSSR